MEGYTKEQVELFEKMFFITVESTCYQTLSLTEQGIQTNEPYEVSYNTACSHIKLSNGNEYIIDYGQDRDAEGAAIDAFHQLIELNYDEEVFEQYIIKKSRFRPAYC